MRYKFIYFLLLFFPIISLATVTYSQPDSTTQSTDDMDISWSVQTLGTGLSGSVHRISFYGVDTDGGDNRVYWRLYECVDNGYVGCTLVRVGNALSDPSPMLVGSTKTFVGHNSYTDVGVLSDYTLNSSKYYMILFLPQSTSQFIFGTTGSSYANGACYLGSSTSTPCTNLADIAFFIEDSTSTYSSGQFVLNSPIQNITTPTGLVLFNFDAYNNSVVDYYDKYGIQIQNVTDGQNLIPLETNILSSGGISFSTTTSLATNKQYLWRAYMRSSTGSSTPLYSSYHNFYTVSSPYPQTTLPNTVVATASSTSGSATSTTSGYIGTTTINTINPDSILPSEWSEVMRTRFPFSYVYDGFRLITELAEGTTTGNAYFTIPLGGVFTDPDTGSTTTQITVIDPSAITATGYLTQIRAVSGYAIYFMTGLYLIGAIMSAI